MNKNSKGRRTFIQKMALGATSLSGMPLLLSREEQVNRLNDLVLTMDEVYYDTEITFGLQNNE